MESGCGVEADEEVHACEPTSNEKKPNKDKNDAMQLAVEQQAAHSCARMAMRVYDCAAQFFFLLLCTTVQFSCFFFGRWPQRCGPGRSPNMMTTLTFNGGGRARMVFCFFVVVPELAWRIV